MVMTLRIVCLSLCLLLASSFALGAATDVARMERAIDLRVSTGQFMGAVLVARGGKILINKAYGKANLSRNIPDSPATQFVLGSVTKQFTAACILLLQDRGKLKIEESIKDYLPEAPPAWQHITFFNLLTHTSGIPDFTDFPDFVPTMATPTTPDALIARFKKRPLQFQPGNSFHYSNSGYALLGYLIERISGEPYSRFVQENIFTPLAMNHSGYYSRSTRISRLAVGYEPEHSGPAPAPSFDASVIYSAGGLYSTTGDLQRWERALYGGKVLSKASLQKMMTPFRDRYALGLGARKTPNGQRLFWHNGGMPGYTAWVGYLPAEDVDVIVLSNLSGLASQAIGNDMVRVADGERVTLISDRKAMPLPPDALDRFSGHYHSKDDEIITVQRDGNHLTTELPGRDAIAFYPEREGDFFAKVIDCQIEFDRNAEGQVVTLVLHQDGTRRTADRINSTTASPNSDAFAQRHDPIRASESATALRRLIEALEAGSPDFDGMTPALAAAMSTQVDPLRLRLAALGGVRSIELEQPLPFGVDLYRVQFEHGTLECRIRLSQSGKIADARLRQ